MGLQPDFWIEKFCYDNGEDGIKHLQLLQLGFKPFSTIQAGCCYYDWSSLCHKTARLNQFRANAAEPPSSEDTWWVLIIPLRNIFFRAQTYLERVFFSLFFLPQVSNIICQRLLQLKEYKLQITTALRKGPHSSSVEVHLFLWIQTRNELSLLCAVKIRSHNNIFKQNDCICFIPHRRESGLCPSSRASRW